MSNKFLTGTALYHCQESAVASTTTYLTDTLDCKLEAYVNDFYFDETNSLSSLLAFWTFHPEKTADKKDLTEECKIRKNPTDSTD